MPYFLSPKVIYGKGSLKRLSAELEGKGSRAAILTDRTLIVPDLSVLETSLTLALKSCEIFSNSYRSPE